MTDRDALEEPLVAHQRRDITGCVCGWSKLGYSHPGHQAELIREQWRLVPVGSDASTSDPGFLVRIPPGAREEWLTEDEQIILLNHEGLTDQQIGERTGRPTKIVATHRRWLGLPYREG